MLAPMDPVLMHRSSMTAICAQALLMTPWMYLMQSHCLVMTVICHIFSLGMMPSLWGPGWWSRLVPEDFLMRRGSLTTDCLVPEGWWKMPLASWPTDLVVYSPPWVRIQRLLPLLYWPVARSTTSWDWGIQVSTRDWLMRRMTTTELSQDSGGKVLVCRTLRMWLVATGIHRLPRDRDCIWSIIIMLQ